MKTFLTLITVFYALNAFSLSVPSLTQPVMDLASAIDDSSKQEIDKKIRQLHKDGVAQISVLIIPSLENEVLEEYSIKVAETWKLGDKEKDNGLLLLVAMKERKIRVEVGSGLEGEITDIEASRMISAMKSHMRNKNYGKGVIAAIDKAVHYIDYNSPENKALRAEEERIAAEKRAKAMEAIKSKAGFVLAIVVWLLALFSIFSKINERKELLKRVPQLQTETSSLEERHNESSAKLSKMKVDKDKQEYKYCQDHVQSLEYEKSSLEQEIRKMKKYLGVK